MFKNDYKTIKESGLFDEKYYFETYEDVRKANIDPIKHYIRDGWKEGRNPSKRFDTNFYLDSYPDVRDAKINPLVHFIKYGNKEGRSTHRQNNILVSDKISKIKKLISVVKHAKNNPQLVKRTIQEIKLYGIKKTIIKIRNKLHRIENSFVSQKEAKNFEELVNIFNENIFIPHFETQKPIDIIIPVYNGFQYLEPLLNSIIKNTYMDYKIIICDDKSSDEKVLHFLKKFKNENSHVDITLLENERNLGFIKTVNKLVKHTNNHFVLLNTDTEVPPYWIERLMYPIFEMKNIASTTPFTNAGTICSFPNYLEDNPIFENMNIEELDSYFQYVNFEKTFIEIPTGVGFCMGVNKNLVNKIGMFDEVFGKGYGEENDWCQRAIKNGYKNIHVTNLFVYHKHGGSFSSEEKQKLIIENLGILNKKHPTYDEEVQKIIYENKLETLRKYLTILIKNKKSNTVLIIDHGLGGGASHYIDESLESKIKEKKMVILMRYDFNITKDYNINFFSDKFSYKFSSKNISYIFTELSKFKINEIFINSLVSYPNVYNIIESIIALKKQTQAKVILPIHDFFPLCPSYTLLNEKMEYCGIPQDFKICENCLKNNKNEFKIFEKEENIGNWRKSWNKINDLSDEIICFSNSSKDIFLKAYPNSDKKIKVIPHDISGRYEKIYSPNIKNDKTIIGVLGGINEAKGAIIVKNLVSYIDENKINAKVVLIGQISIPISSESFVATGRYDKKDLPDIVKKYNITKFFIPSIWPETFSYTTDEIMQMGYPLIVFDLGAPAERVKNYELGMVINLNSFEKKVIKI